MSFSSKQIFHLDYNNQRRLCCYCDICFSYIAYPRLRQNMLQSVLLVIALIAFASGMPYQVPMQGKAGGKRTLIILDDVSSGNSYSLFFEALESRGHLLSFMHSGQKIILNKYNQYIYDNVVIFAPGMEKNMDAISDFTENGGNLIIAVDEEISSGMRGLLASFGIEMDKPNYTVIDHFSYEASADDTLQHSAILSRNALSSKVFLGSFSARETPVIYSGISHSVDEDNIFVAKVLRGNPSTYSANPNKAIDSLDFGGEKTLLVSAIQARNNARIIVSGSLEMFSNVYFRSKDSSTGSLVGNEIFCAELSKWAFAERGVLRFSDIRHHTSDGSPPDIILHEKDRPDLPHTLFPDPELTRNSLVYRIKDEIMYSMLVEEFADGSWRPFYATDMQMEFVMMDPYVRTNMTADPSGRFTAKFISPDDYGIFKFRVLYRRSGYSIIHAETKVSIRPFKHNEYERFILSAFPYYSSAFSCMIAFFVFSIFFLYSDDVPVKFK